MALPPVHRPDGQGEEGQGHGTQGDRPVKEQLPGQGRGEGLRRSQQGRVVEAAVIVAVVGRLHHDFGARPRRKGEQGVLHPGAVALCLGLALLPEQHPIHPDAAGRKDLLHLQGEGGQRLGAGEDQPVGSGPIRAAPRLPAGEVGVLADIGLLRGPSPAVGQLLRGVESVVELPATGQDRQLPRLQSGGVQRLCPLYPAGGQGGGILVIKAVGQGEQPTHQCQGQ